MSRGFHEGERAVQARAGVTRRAERVGESIQAEIPAVAVRFLESQAWAILGGRDTQGNVWASPLWGTPGFLQVEDESTLRIDTDLLPGDPLADTLMDATGEVPVGLLVIEPETRRRMRLNGWAAARPEGGLTVWAEEVYANCAKYIQKRESQPVADARPGNRLPRRHAAPLTATQRAFVTEADTFFIASIHPEVGADASHRGGNPGFVQVTDDGQSLLWPDYSGNAMFNTLGNLLAEPSAGLLFLDWEQGSVLQLTGEAEILWDDPVVQKLPGAERAVRFHVTETVEWAAGTLPFAYRFLELSPVNPV